MPCSFGCIPREYPCMDVAACPGEPTSPSPLILAFHFVLCSHQLLLSISMATVKTSTLLCLFRGFCVCVCVSGLALSFLHGVLNQKRDSWLPNPCFELGPRSRVRIGGQDPPHNWTGCCQVASRFQPCCYFPHLPKIPICNSAALFSPGAFPCFFHHPSLGVMEEQQASKWQ